MSDSVKLENTHLTLPDLTLPYLTPHQGSEQSAHRPAIRDVTKNIHYERVTSPDGLLYEADALFTLKGHTLWTVKCGEPAAIDTVVGGKVGRTMSWDKTQ